MCGSKTLFFNTTTNEPKEVACKPAGRTIVTLEIGAQVKVIDVRCTTTTIYICQRVSRTPSNILRSRALPAVVVGDQI